jgi:PAS domain S-box-containing protein
MSVVAWKMYPFTRNNYLMYLGCGYFWIAILDMLHALTYKGMAVVPATSTETTIQLWIGARWLEALLLVSAPLFLTRELLPRQTFAVFGGAAIALCTAILTGTFPHTFVEGSGLTPFKVGSEYAIIVLLGVAASYLWQRRSLLDRRILYIMIAAIILTMCAELAFTFYVGYYDLANLIGHIFKLFSFWLIFVAMVRTTLEEPFRAMARGASTYDAVPDATIVVDEKGLIRQANQAACRLAASPESQLLGRHNHEVFHDPRIAAARCPICTYIASHQAVHSLEQQLADEERWFEYTLSPIHWHASAHGVVQVIRDISDKKRAARELHEYREHLEQLVAARTAALEATNKELEAFSYSVSHDLRAPLRHIEGFSQMLQEDYQDKLDDAGRDYIARIRKASRRMGQLIDDLLKLSRVTRRELQWDTLDLSELAAEIAGHLQEMQPQRRVTVFIQPDLQARGDKRLLRIMLENLFDNAWKYTGKVAEARIEFGCLERDGRPVYYLSDNGAGFDMGHYDKLFAPLQRLHKSNEFEGTGIGLATVMRIINRHGGRLWGEGTPGAGATFYFTLPATLSAPLAKAAGSGQQ